MIGVDWLRGRRQRQWRPSASTAADEQQDAGRTLVESAGDVTTYIGIVRDDGPGYMGEAVADETAVEPERPDDFGPYDTVAAEDVP